MACNPATPPNPVVTPPSCTDWNSDTFFEEASVGDVDRCLKGGADINARTKYGSPLHDAAAWSKTPTVVQVLLDAGADPNARNEDGETSLDRAVGFSKTPEVVEALLDDRYRKSTRIADVDVINARTKNG